MIDSWEQFQRGAETIKRQLSRRGETTTEGRVTVLSAGRRHTAQRGWWVVPSIPLDITALAVVVVSLGVLIAGFALLPILVGFKLMFGAIVGLGVGFGLLRVAQGL